MPIEPAKQKNIKDRNLNEIWDSIKSFFHDLVDIREGMDREGTLANIHGNKKMKGANAWLLMCSIVVASLGLDLNSPAVIIGAMLISPLMSPILGIGLGIGINDRETLVTSLQHWFISIAIALLTSFLYFVLTPFGNITDEISARTQPNLLDGLVAIFGGLAGVISITRMDKSNAIPGVAIATALMPPLCVAGFGLAKGEWGFFLNAFYLFFLNSSFIAITTYIIIRTLRFPYKKYMNNKERNRGRLSIIFFSLIILLPASRILYTTLKKITIEQKVDNYLQKKIKHKSSILSEWTFAEDSDIVSHDSLQILLKVIGEPLSREYLETCDQELEAILGKTVSIITYQSKEIPYDDIKNLDTKVSGMQGKIQAQLKEMQALQESKSGELLILKSQIDSLSDISLNNVYQEVKTIFPLINEIAIVDNVMKTDFNSTSNVPIVLVKWGALKASKERKMDDDKLMEFIKVRTGLDTLVIIDY
jgi:uncharacterized hydrophobic protein (TIGR00271 family)